MSRLIDAERLRKDILNLQDCYNGFSDTYDKACIIGVIDEQPTIDPVKHGRWMPYEFGDETWHKCSECNTADQYGNRYTAFDGKEHIFFAVRQYCPNCGARMDGEEDD